MIKPEVKDVIDTYAKVLEVHISSVDIQCKAFPQSKYWEGQMDALLKLRDALTELELEKSL